MLHVFLPLKDPVWAKTRLAGLLSDEQREALVEAMALDVMDAVLNVGSGTRLSVIAPGYWQGRLPQRPDLNLLREEQLASTGLNGVLREAVVIERPDRALVLHGDLPGLEAQAVRAAARALQDHEVVICPDAAGVGTNALGFRGDAMPEFRFGPDSFSAHQRCAEAGAVAGRCSTERAWPWISTRRRTLARSFVARHPEHPSARERRSGRPATDRPCSSRSGRLRKQRLPLCRRVRPRP